MTLTPQPADKFTFGLWTVGNVGRDPFGEPTRKPLEPTYIVAKLAELGAYGVNLHDNDLVPAGASAGERDRIVKEFKEALEQHGLVVPMATTNLFADPVFKDGAFTAADARVRAYALQKTMASMDLGAELGAETYVFWGGREGAEVDAGGKLLEGLETFRDCLNFLAAYSEAQGYGFRFALEPKPNEPRGDLYLPTVGSALGFIATLDRPERFGVNPEFAHETMAGLSFPHALAQALDAGCNALDALAHFREALNFLCEYSESQGYGFKFALEPKPNEPRGDIYLPTVGAALGFIATLEKPEHFGVNPEFAHDTMAGLSFPHAIAQAIDAVKLFHVDLNDQKPGRFDQDLRFGAENLKGAFFTVKLLEDSGYSGVRHFDAHALRTEDEAGVWDFATGCMKTYLILKEKVRQFAEDREIQELIAAYKARDELLEGLSKTFSKGNAEQLKDTRFDLETLRGRGPGLERLDQLTVELLLGVR